MSRKFLHTPHGAAGCITLDSGHSASACSMLHASNACMARSTMAGWHSKEIRGSLSVRSSASRCAALALVLPTKSISWIHRKSNEVVSRWWRLGELNACARLAEPL